MEGSSTARDTAAAAGQNASTGQGLSSTYTNNAAQNASVLTPTLNRMATNPQGFSQKTLGDMNTAALQSASGAAAGQVGSALQRSAATNNAGAATGLVAAANQDAQHQYSDAALGVQNKNAMVQEQQRQEGLQGLEGQYNTNVGAGENALGLSNQALNAQTNAGQSGWFQNSLGLLNALGKKGAGA